MRFRASKYLSVADYIEVEFPLTIVKCWLQWGWASSEPMSLIDWNEVELPLNQCTNWLDMVGVSYTIVSIFYCIEDECHPKQC